MSLHIPNPITTPRISGLGSVPVFPVLWRHLRHEVTEKLLRLCLYCETVLIFERDSHVRILRRTFRGAIRGTLYFWNYWSRKSFVFRYMSDGISSNRWGNSPLIADPRYDLLNIVNMI